MRQYANVTIGCAVLLMCRLAARFIHYRFQEIKSIKKDAASLHQVAASFLKY